MLDLATMNPEYAKKAIELAGKAADAVESKFPGISLWLNDRAQLNHSKRMMEASLELRKYGESIGIDQMLLDAFVASAMRDMGADERVAECIARAIPSMDDPEKIGELDDDKAEYWRSHAEKARSDEMRTLWAAILAGEVNKPGAVSKRTMSIVSDMGRNDAEVFEKLCAMSIGGYCKSISKMMSPKLFAEAGIDNTYCEETIVYGEIANMESLGLVKMGSQYIFELRDKAFVAAIGEREYVIRKDGENDKLTFSSVTFTDYGTELASLFVLGTSTMLLPAFVKHVENTGLIIQELPV